MDTSGSQSVRVAVNIRPLVTSELALGCSDCISVTPDEPQLQIGSHSFTFDYVYGTTGSPSTRIFHDCVEPLVDALFHGYNTTVFAYGQIQFMTSFIMVSGNACCLSIVYYMFFYSRAYYVCIECALILPVNAFVFLLTAGVLISCIGRLLSTNDLIVKALADCMTNAKENFDGHLLSSIRNVNPESVKLLSKMISVSKDLSTEESESITCSELHNHQIHPQLKLSNITDSGN
ncbi:hypothetical protein QVD17_16531 [Tagetes erecta]|uniref:Kinesin motor domain-containing protein n=1 Tax=Tagetes erecta TaxID=13708 RepID=A0AAD8P0S7_TARER|nr:hypothetical protein QVD17_16531 [Tagetes erecta]